MQIIKPFVTVEIVGLPNDSATQRTDTKAEVCGPKC